MDIDLTGYAVMQVLEHANGPLWKKQVHDRLREYAEQADMINTVSAHTVGRRIEALHQAGLLTSVILRPAALSRDLIIGYRLTDRGREQMIVKRRELIHEKSASLLHDQGCTAQILCQLLADELGVDTPDREQLETLSADTLAALGAFYIGVQKLYESVPVETRDWFLDIIGVGPSIDSPSFAVKHTGEE